MDSMSDKPKFRYRVYGASTEWNWEVEEYIGPGSIRFMLLGKEVMNPSFIVREWEPYASGNADTSEYAKRQAEHIIEVAQSGADARWVMVE